MHYTFIHHLHGQESKRNHLQREYIQQYVTHITFSPNQDRSINILNPYRLRENVYGRFRSLICHSNTCNKWLTLTKPENSRQVWRKKKEWWGHVFIYTFYNEINHHYEVVQSRMHKHTSAGTKGSSARLGSTSGPRSACRNRAAFRLRSACSCFSLHSLEAWASFSRAAAAKRSSSFCLAVLQKREQGYKCWWWGLSVELRNSFCVEGFKWLQISTLLRLC